MSTYLILIDLRGSMVDIYAEEAETMTRAVRQAFEHLRVSEARKDIVRVRAVNVEDMAEVEAPMLVVT